MAIQLDAESLDEVKRILAFHAPGVRTWVFGSRATGTARRFSDLDIALESDEPIAYRTISKLEHAFSESDLPIRVDVVDWNALEPEFREVVGAQRVPLFEEPASE